MQVANSGSRIRDSAIADSGKQDLLNKEEIWKDTPYTITIAIMDLWWVQRVSAARSVWWKVWLCLDWLLQK